MVSLNANLNKCEVTSDISFILIDFDDAEMVGQDPLSFLL